ncbi:MAG: hypothetical protein ACTSR8_11795 [Promethearchaeota archaeon]
MLIDILISVQQSFCVIGSESVVMVLIIIWIIPLFILSILNIKGREYNNKAKLRVVFIAVVCFWSLTYIFIIAIRHPTGPSSCLIGSLSLSIGLTPLRTFLVVILAKLLY